MKSSFWNGVSYLLTFRACITPEFWDGKDTFFSFSRYNCAPMSIWLEMFINVVQLLETIKDLVLLSYNSLIITNWMISNFLSRISVQPQEAGDTKWWTLIANEHFYSEFFLLILEQ